MTNVKYFILFIFYKLHWNHLQCYFIHQLNPNLPQTFLILFDNNIDNNIADDCVFIDLFNYLFAKL